MKIQFDAIDLPTIKLYSWYMSNGYAATMVDKKQIYMHRLIMNPLESEVVDHINGNKLDNRRENLRVCKQHENMANRIKHTPQTSKYKGVSWRKSHSLWQATITKHGLQEHLGYFTTQEEAALAYNKAAIRVHNQFAKLNRVDQNETN